MDKNEVIFKAFQKACKYLRDHPPADTGWEGDTEVLRLIVDAESDPEGDRWACHFINQVLDEAGI